LWVEEDMKKRVMSSICVRVEFVGVLRGITGKDNISVELEKPKPVNEFLENLSEMFKPSFRQALIDSELNDPRPNTLILINDMEISALNGLKTKVADGDKIVLVPWSHGG
jgi:molybdopterin converting factor small subunit